MSWSLFSDGNKKLLSDVKSKFGFSDSDVESLQDEVKKSTDQVKALIKTNALRTLPTREAQKQANRREVQQKLFELISKIATQYSDESVGVFSRTARFGGKGPVLIHTSNGVVEYVQIGHRSLDTLPNDGAVVSFTLNADSFSARRISVSNVSSYGPKAMADRKRRFGFGRFKRAAEPRVFIVKTLERIELDQEFAFTGKGSQRFKASA